MPHSYHDTASTTGDTAIAALVDELGGLLSASGSRIALAESCTGGLLASAIVDDPRHGGMLERGLVVYSVGAKCELLGLDRDAVESCDGVSEEIARAMARATLERSEAQLAVAITGFAGPQEADEEVGLVHIAATSDGGDLLHVEEHFGDLGRWEVRKRSAAAALELAIETLRKQASTDHQG